MTGPAETTWAGLVAAVAEHRVKINRTFRSARNGEIVEASGGPAWAALQTRLLALGVSLESFADPDGTDGLIVTCGRARGPGGTYTVHDLACRHGAPAVIC